MKLASFLLVLIMTGNSPAQENSAIRSAVLDYAEAITTQNVNAIIKGTEPSYLKAIGGENILRARLKKENADMISAGETFVGVSINTIGAAIDRNFSSYRMIEITEQIKTPGGICTINVPYVAVKVKDRLWKFFEAADLNFTSVKAFYKDLANIKIPKKGMRIFLGNQHFTEAMKDYNRSFRAKVRQYGLEYNEPNGYLVSDSAIVTVDAVVGVNHGTMLRSLRSNDGIFIGIIFNGPIVNDGKLEGFPGPDGLPFDPNKNWIPSFHRKYDVLPTEYSRETYNADLVATSQFYQHKNVPILGKYEKCKCIIIHKDNMVDIEIMYFYTSDSTHLLEKCMAETKNLLRFKY